MASVSTAGRRRRRRPSATTRTGADDRRRDLVDRVGVERVTTRRRRRAPSTRARGRSVSAGTRRGARDETSCAPSHARRVACCGSCCTRAQSRFRVSADGVAAVRTSVDARLDARAPPAAGRGRVAFRPAIRDTSRARFRARSAGDGPLCSAHIVVPPQRLGPSRAAADKRAEAPPHLLAQKSYPRPTRSARGVRRRAATAYPRLAAAPPDRPTRRTSDGDRRRPARRAGTAARSRAHFASAVRASTRSRRCVTSAPAGAGALRLRCSRAPPRRSIRPVAVRGR